MTMAKKNSINHDSTFNVHNETNSMSGARTKRSIQSIDSSVGSNRLDIFWSDKIEKVMKFDRTEPKVFTKRHKLICGNVVK